MKNIKAFFQEKYLDCLMTGISSYLVLSFILSFILGFAFFCVSMFSISIFLLVNLPIFIHISY